MELRELIQRSKSRPDVYAPALAVTALQLEAERDAAELMSLALHAERDQLRAKLETESMRLVACSVVALANTPESAVRAREMHPDYQSPYCNDVARMVDREMQYRAELAECKRDADLYRALRYGILHGIDPDYQGDIDDDTPMAELFSDFDRVCDALKVKVDAVLAGEGDKPCPG